MDQKTMVKQVFDFQRNTFDNLFNSMATIQDQAEKSVSFMLERSPWVPEESRSVIMEWGRLYKKGRDDFKRAVDDGYDKLGSYIVTTGEATRHTAQQAARSAAEAGSKATGKASRSA